MNTITLTIEATPENIKKIADFFAEEKPKKKPAKAEKPAEKPAPEPKPEPEPEQEKVTKTQLRSLGLALTKEGKADELKAALSKFGAAKLSQVKEEDYEALYKTLQETLS